MHPERVVITRASAIAAIVAVVVGAFGSLLLGHLSSIIQIIIISSSDRP
jgi:hypothetical protein